MLRWIHMMFMALVAALADFPVEAVATERWRIHHLNRSLNDFADSWDRLNQRSLAGHPMQDSRFIDGMLRHFGDGSEYLCHLEKDGEPIGVCLLKRARPGVWRSFLPAQAQLAPAILARGESLPALLPTMPGLVGQVDLLCQDPVFSPAFRCGRVPVRTQRHALTMNVSTDGGFEAYWSERPKNLRGAIRSRENRLAKAGLQPRLVCLTATEQMRDAVGRFAALETSGWKGRAGTALGSDSIQGPFYAEIMERFAETGQAFVYEYWLDDRLAASQLAIAAGSMLVLLKTTYNEEFAYYSPGRLLLREVIRDSFERFPGGAVEFYTNADSDQLAWATGQRWIEHVTLYRNPAVEQIVTGVQSLRRWLQAAMRRGPRAAEQSA